MRVRIKEVAEVAGVSTATVSRVINNVENSVRDEIKEKVWDAIKKTGYKPNLIAKSMVTNKTHTIAVLSPDIVNPFYHDVIRGVNKYAQDKNYNVFLYNTHNDNEVNLDMLISRGIDGAILVGFFESTTLEICEKLKPIPVVIMDKMSTKSGLPRIFTDDFESSYNMTQYLVEMGHKKIACVIGPKKYDIIKERLKGYKKVLKENNIAYDKSLIKDGGLVPEKAEEVAQEILANDDITAIYCFNDLMAYGVYSACRKLNKRIPEDVSVVGFDGITYSKYLSPPLTTVKQPGYEIGLESTKLLLDLIEEESIKDYKIKLHNELLIRESVKNINIIEGCSAKK